MKNNYRVNLNNDGSGLKISIDNKAQLLNFQFFNEFYTLQI